MASTKGSKWCMYNLPNTPSLIESVCKTELPLVAKSTALFHEWLVEIFSASALPSWAGFDWLADSSDKPPAANSSWALVTSVALLIFVAVSFSETFCKEAVRPPSVDATGVDEPESAASWTEVRVHFLQPSRLLTFSSWKKKHHYHQDYFK